jgi:hypothetical protein
MDNKEFQNNVRKGDILYILSDHGANAKPYATVEFTGFKKCVNGCFNELDCKGLVAYKNAKMIKTRKKGSIQRHSSVFKGSNSCLRNSGNVRVLREAVILTDDLFDI